MARILVSKRVCISRAKKEWSWFGGTRRRNFVGDPAMMRAAIRISPGKHRYTSLVIAFGDQDIDVAEFNNGQPEARSHVDTVLSLYSEIACAGVPADCRPPILVTTHTHVGNLELNIIVPRWIRRSNGVLRAFNPDPPGTASRECWEAFEDYLNAAFGWSSPRDPQRRQWYNLPGWLVKRRAAVLRSGGAWEPTVREIICDRIADAVRSGLIENRADVEAWLSRHVSEFDMTVLTIAAHHITIGPENAPARDRIRLRGLVFSTDFSCPDALVHPVIALDGEVRAARLADAAARLQAAWERRAAFNTDRFGRGQWPVPDFDATRFLDAPRPRLPRTIPPKRIDRISTRPEEDSHHDRSSEPAPAVGADSHGAGAPDPHRRVGTGADAGSSGPEQEDRDVGGRAPSEGRGHRTLDRYTDILAGPRGPGEILTAIARRLRAVLPRLIARLTFRRLATLVPPTLPETLTATASALETMNATLDRNLSRHRRPDDRRGHRLEA